MSPISEIDVCNEELNDLAIYNLCPLKAKELRKANMPSTKRKKDASDKRSITCNNCLQRGHNIRSCKNPKQEKSPKMKKKRGRPRIHELHVRASRGATPIGAQEFVGVQESQELGFETKDAPLFFLTDVPFHEHIVYETHEAKTQEKIKDLRDSGYTAAEIEEALSIEDKKGKTQPPVYDKSRRRSERILKIKLSKPVFDKDGGGSCVEKALTLD